mmetsp:Transcript_25186/g.72840  ORF Transcript_25186/g.72840 Transcript_25186/m.72840 type:complete len:327 (+) Transcript_25186:75-1055(+)
METGCTSIFCQYATDPNVTSANATNVTDWLRPSDSNTFGTANGNATANSLHNDDWYNLIGVLLFGCFVLSVSIYYLTRAALRRRLYSRLLLKYWPTEYTTCTGTVIKKVCRNVGEWRGESSGLFVVVGITPVEEVYQPWPVAPFHMYVCYEAPPSAAIDGTAEPAASQHPTSSDAQQGRGHIIKKLENVSKKRFMNTKPGDLVEIQCLKGKPRSGIIRDEVQWSRSVAVEDEVLWAFFLFLGVGLCAWGIRFTDTTLVSVPALVAALCLVISIKVHRGQSKVLEEKLVDGGHDASKTFSAMEESSDAGDTGADQFSSETNEPGEIV